MLTHLVLNAGPMPRVSLDPAPRLNVFTGENGTGKTFMLDLIWWVLTETWAGEPAAPHTRSSGAQVLAEVQFGVTEVCLTGIGVVHPEGQLRWSRASFDKSSGHNLLSIYSADTADTAVIYAKDDGSFRLFHSRYSRGGRPLSADEVARELMVESYLWTRTVEQQTEAFKLLQHILTPVESTQRWMQSPERAPAGIKRLLSILYMLLTVISNPPTPAEIVLLIDEPELHLHPQWQRTILPGLLRVLQVHAPKSNIQVFIAAHSPLVLASLECIWDDRRVDGAKTPQDRLFTLRQSEDPNGGTDSHVDIQSAFIKEGSVGAWLRSATFGPGLDRSAEDRSVEAELAINAALYIMHTHQPEDAEPYLHSLFNRLMALPVTPVTEGAEMLIDNSKRLAARVHAALTITLSGHDEFWSRWTMCYSPNRREDAYWHGQEPKEQGA